MTTIVHDIPVTDEQTFGVREYGADQYAVIARPGNAVVRVLPSRRQATQLRSELQKAAQAMRIDQTIDALAKAGLEPCVS